MSIFPKTVSVNVMFQLVVGIFNFNCFNGGTPASWEQFLKWSLPRVSSKFWIIPD